MKKNATVKRKVEKKEQHPHEYWTSFESKGLPVAKQLLIAEEIVNQASQPGQYTLLGALIALRIPRPTFNQWLDKYPIIAESWNHARNIITRKRFDCAANKTASEKLFNFVPQYCEEYGDYAVWIESIRAAKEAARQASQVTINMTDYGAEIVNEDPHAHVAQS